MKLKSVGYFKEMPHGVNSKDSIYDYIKKEKTSDIKKICAYLDAGIELIVSPGVVEDVINPERGTAGVTSTYTDGVWLWPGDLSYYVRNYKLKLPEEFIKTMQQNDWKVRIKIEDLDFSDIEVDGIKLFNEE